MRIRSGTFLFVSTCSKGCIENVVLWIPTFWIRVATYSVLSQLDQCRRARFYLEKLAPNATRAKARKNIIGSNHPLELNPVFTTTSNWLFLSLWSKFMLKHYEQCFPLVPPPLFLFCGYLQCPSMIPEVP